MGRFQPYFDGQPMFNIIFVNFELYTLIEISVLECKFYKMKEQDLGRKWSAWKDFGLELEISLSSSLRDRVKWNLGLGVNCSALEKPTYKILAKPRTLRKVCCGWVGGGWVVV